MQSWRQLITKAMARYNESWNDVEACTLDDASLDVRFDAGYGTPKGKPFTLWTSNRVYFPVTYDGAEWVSSVPRNPCAESIHHVGS